MQSNKRFLAVVGSVWVWVTYAMPVSAAALATVVVTASREAQQQATVPSSVSVVGGDAIRSQRPTHPNSIMNQQPGVWVSNLSGEGHSTAIRQPLTTGPSYLFLEDGIPTRSSGFYNHNALYEVNVPQSGGIEITKGPGSALYGSDAIGGTVNVLTRTPPTEAEAEGTVETGSNGWARTLFSGGDAYDNGAWRANLNLTRTAGWHDRAEYDRESASLRWDHALTDNTVTKTVLSWSHIDQHHVGSVGDEDYKHDPKKNNASISARAVDALRLSTNIEQENGNRLWSFTPYYRDNRMTILPNWSLSYDATQYTTENESVGLLSKYRVDIEPLHTRLIVGLDLDYSPGTREEDKVDVVAEGTGINRHYDDFTRGAELYDYDVTFSSVSPYVQAELSPTEKWRVTVGLRYDDMKYDYANHMTENAVVASGGSYGHVDDRRVEYDHWSPKFGMTYAMTDHLNGFLNLSHAFRIPSEGQVFRPARVFGTNAAARHRARAAAVAATELEPVQVDNMEIGVRGETAGWDYEVSFYHMIKEDDILSYRDPVSTQVTTVNAGETRHRGIEMAIGHDIGEQWRFDVSYSYAKHTYETWEAAVNNTLVDYSGNEMETAPRVLANTRLQYRPAFMNGGGFTLEWQRVGSYWRDQANTRRYDGHDLLGVRARYPLNDKLECYGNINNVFDKRYAEVASLSGTEEAYTVGLPRTVYVGIRYVF